MSLTTLEPSESWDAAGSEEAIETLGAGEYVFKVWGGDWCIDCRQQLPEFAAALKAAGVPEERIEHHPVEKTINGKEGPGVEAYNIELIPTVVVEEDGEEIARFVESANDPIAVALADQLADRDESA